MNGTKKLVVGGVVAAGLMVGAAALVVGAGLAHADDGLDDAMASIYGGGHMGDQDAYSFWNQLDEYTHGVTVKTAQAMATTVCQSLAAGQSEGRIVASMVSDTGIDSASARLNVHGAAYHFCPAYF